MEFEELVATAVMTVVMYMGSAMMGMGMDMPMMLGTMVLPQGSAARGLGLILHFMMGVIFFVIYAGLFEAWAIEDGIVGWSALFGLVHGLIAGTDMGMMGVMHPRMGMEAGSLPAPASMGLKMGAVAPMAILAVHLTTSRIVSDGWRWSVAIFSVRSRR